MRQAISHWTNLFVLFASQVLKEVNHFFETGDKNNKNPKTNFHKIPRLGR